MTFTECYVRDRKVGDWGTGIQPTCFGYDDADRMVTLTTFRAGTETVSSNPSDRSDGDTTTWSYHNASGMEISKTYADSYIRTSYTYSPYGSVTESGNTWQPIQWSSEYNDTGLGLVYYNYRHYNSIDGRWLGRDKLEITGGSNLYGFTFHKTYIIDFLGLLTGEKLYECINIKVTTKIKWLIILNEEIE